MKYRFKSFLANQFEGYLKFRRGYGFKAECDYAHLCVFDKYLISREVKSFLQLSEQFYSEMMAEELEELKPQTVNGRMMALKNFYKYMQRQHQLTTNPVEAFPRLRELYYSPHVFSPAEITIILAHLADRAAKSPKCFFPVRLARYSACALQAACGLRVSEVTNLKISDFDQTNKTIFIRRSKFRKDRLIPISDKAVCQIENYLNVRRSVAKENSPHLFLSYWGEKAHRATMADYFSKALKSVNMHRKPEIKGNMIFGSPCPHSLRHSFAVNTIKRWIAEGKDVDKIADTLATYMGHADFAFTQVYLKSLSQTPAVLIFSKAIKYHDE